MLARPRPSALRLCGALLAAALAVAQAAPAPAANPVWACESAKLGATARFVRATVACHAVAARRGRVVDDACLARVAARFHDAYGRPSGCPDAASADLLAERVEVFAAELAATLRENAGKSRCAAERLASVGVREATALRCRAAQARRGAEAKPACLERSDERFAVAWARSATAPGGCSAIDVAPVLESSEDLLAALVDLIELGYVSSEAVPRDLAAVVDGGSVALSWQPPGPASGYTEVRLLRRLNAPPSGPDDPDAVVLLAGPGSAATDPVAGLLPDTSLVPRAYHYAVFACTAMGDCTSEGGRTAVVLTVTQALRAGGYTIHWRHAAADVCSDQTGLGKADATSMPGWWRSCDASCATATARQLNGTGVADATAIGEDLDALGIPIGRVLSSEFCRNLTTAALMDFGPAVEELPELTYFVYDEASRCADTYALIAEVPAAGTNTAMIGHAGFPALCPELGSLQWGEAAIFKPDGGGGALFIRRVLPQDWLGLP